MNTEILITVIVLALTYLVKEYYERQATRDLLIQYAELVEKYAQTMYARGKRDAMYEARESPTAEAARELKKGVEALLKAVGTDEETPDESK